MPKQKNGHDEKARSHWLNIAEPLMRLPTAPFREEAVRVHIQAFCRRLGMRVRQDGMGNLMADWHSRGSAPTLILEAHMDHPGFIMEADSRRNRTTAVFYGRVEDEYFPGAPVRAYAADGERCGRVVGRPKAISERGRRVSLDLNGPVRRDDIGMWDVPVFRERNGMLEARACDDLAGCASLLTFLDTVAVRPERRNVGALFTVAEEAGLNGALYVCQRRWLSARTTIVSIETSREWPHARRGDGVVVRVGDIARVFDPPVTAYMLQAARAVAGKDPAFRYQRKLMDGGTCESSAYQAFGYATGAVCVPLANYHNRDFARRSIAAERVALGDLASMVKLFGAMTESWPDSGRFRRPHRPVCRAMRGPLGERFMLKDAPFSA